MSIFIIRNNLSLDQPGHIPCVAVMAELGKWRNDRIYINLFLANPDLIPDEAFQVAMGNTFEQLTSHPDYSPASDKELAENNEKLFSTILDLQSDEILPWTWPDNRWKVEWLINHNIAKKTGKHHVVASYPIPIMQLTTEFYNDCMNLLIP